MENKTIFFSYARVDSDFALRLAQALRDKGANIWLDQLDIEPGSRWDVSIENALKNSGVLLVILTQESVKSDNVMDEVSFALEKGKLILPVLYKACEIPLRLRRRQFVDFTQGFDKGIESLKVTLNLKEEKTKKISKEILKTSEDVKERRVIQLKEEDEARKQKVDHKEVEKNKLPEYKETSDQSRKRSKKKLIICSLIGMVIILGIWGVYVSGLWEMTGKKTADSGDEFTQTETGLKYKFHYRSNNMRSPKEGEFIDIDILFHTPDTVLFDSRELPASKKSPVPMVNSTFMGDISEGLAMMHIGDSATFAVVADSMWILLYASDTPPEGMEATDYFYYEIKLNNIFSREELAKYNEARDLAIANDDNANRKAYLSSNYPNANPTSSGLYYIKVREGNGKKPGEGQNVKVQYTGRLLDGTLFDRSGGDPMEFPLGMGRVIKGWDEGIALMRVGEKAVLIIPPELAFGAKGSNNIPPNSTVVFQVELISIAD